MKNKAQTLRTGLRIFLLASLFFGPAVMLASANADDGAKSMSGAGFVLYVSLMRPRG